MLLRVTTLTRDITKANPPSVGGDRRSESFSVTPKDTEISQSNLRNMRQVHDNISDTENDKDSVPVENEVDNAQRKFQRAAGAH